MLKSSQEKQKIDDSRQESTDMDICGGGDVSSFNDTDDDALMVGDAIYKDPVQTGECKYEVLTLDEIAECQQKIINDINNVLKLSPTITRVLLSHFNWDKEKLFDAYFEKNPDEVFKCARIINPFKTATNNDNLIDSKECEICLTNFQSSDDTMIGLGCGHSFCLKCWREYLTTKIVEEGLGQSISCAANGCDILVDDGIVSQLVHDPEIRIKYQKLLVNSFIECNKLFRFCPSANCTYIIKVLYVEASQIRCKCGHEFCFQCGENWHGPVQCIWLKKWLKKCDGDVATSSWIAVNTKECPNCKTTIQKDGGCNHMVCPNNNCKYDFCWICLGPWQPHGTSWYNCNRYNEDDARAARNDQGEARNSLERYVHFYGRYINQMDSMAFENELCEYIISKIEKMQQQKISWHEYEFLGKAVTILRQCRRTLMYTYVFAYYVKKNNQTMIFEDNQRDLETATELLSEYLERGIQVPNKDNIKCIVLDKSNYCEKRRQVLLDHISEGHEEEWWEFLEQ